LHQGAAPRVKAAKPAKLCHGGAWLVEECLVVIPGWQMAVHGLKRHILAGYCHCDGESWLAEENSWRNVYLAG
jgi:hypothetical protein